LQGNLGRSVVKISAVAPEHRRITAPARVFDSQEAVLDAFRGALQSARPTPGRATSAAPSVSR